MTISYSLETSTQNLTNFHRLLFRWRGSVWQCIYKELTIWLVIYGLLSVLYRFVLTEAERKTFESVALFCDKYSSYIPLTFMLGFYVNFVISRWWDYFMYIPWPDDVALLIATNISGNDDATRNLRRTIVRYIICVQVIVFRMISTAAKKRFPTMQHFVEGGLFTEEELRMYDAVNSEHWKHWIPLRWANQLVMQARQEGKIDNDMMFREIFEKMNKFKVMVGTLACYDWISLPLVYTQVAHIGVRSFFLVALMGRQSLNPKVYNQNWEEIDIYIPIFTLLQFVFYVGWMKVAEVGINPLGEDDDDFEVNWFIDRNLQVGYSIVDDGRELIPSLDKDSWGDNPSIPYTEASAGLMNRNAMGSCAQITVTPDQAALISTKSHHRRPSTSRKRAYSSLPGSRRTSRCSSPNQRGKRFRETKSSSVQITDWPTPPPMLKMSDFLKRKVKGSRLVRMLSVDSTEPEYMPENGFNVRPPSSVSRNVSFGSTVSTMSHITEALTGIDIQAQSGTQFKRGSSVRSSSGRQSERSSNAAVLDALSEIQSPSQPTEQLTPCPTETATEYQPKLEVIPEKEEPKLNPQILNVQSQNVS